MSDKNQFRACAWLGATGLLASSFSFASGNVDNPNISLVLDGAFQDESAALSGGEKGFSLGHTELSLDSNIDSQFYGRLTAVLEEHGNTTEVNLEEAYVESIALPANLTVKAGRFLAGVGYLNQRHTHEDDFARRPAVYRALLGSHYFDDGIRLSWLAPTDIYWRLQAEAFNGKKLQNTTHDKAVGVTTVNSRIGGDLGQSHSWQFGLSYLNNRLTDAATGDTHDHAEEEAGHDHAHAHGASFSGEDITLVDGVWKWSPKGNNRQRELKLSGEYLVARNINQYAKNNERQEGWYLTASYKFAPAWRIAARVGEVELQEPHGDHFHARQMTESDLSLTWSRTHFSKVRLTLTHQDSEDFNTEDLNLTLQYQMVMGAHGAHDF